MRKRRLKLATKVAVITLALALLSFTAAFLFFPKYFFNKSGNPGGAAAAGKFDTDRVNIVLLGFDRDEIRGKSSDIFRPDTIMIASIDFEDRKVALLSIPRDSYVKIAGTEIYDKINHAYMYGYHEAAAAGKDKHQAGMETTIRTIEDFLGGIPIHYYVAVDMEGVVEIVDQVGGVYFDVKYPIRTKYGTGRLLVDKGYQLLDGRKFLYYVRDRSVGGDFGRASRQQEILIEAFRQIKARGQLKDIPAIYRSVQKNVETNLSLGQIAQLAIFGLRLDPEDISAHVFPGSVQLAARNGQNVSYVVINEKRRVEIIKEVFGIDVPLRPTPALPPPIIDEPQEEIPGPSEKLPKPPEEPPVLPSDEFETPIG